MNTIQASVGIRNGDQCFNLPDDQLTVIRLLDRVLPSLGGTSGNDLEFAAPVVGGTCSHELHQAILHFQTTNQAEVLYVDGHIDPGGGSIRCLSRLADQAIGPVDVSEIHLPPEQEFFAVPTVAAPDGTQVPIAPQALRRSGRSLVQEGADIHVTGSRPDGFIVVINNLAGSQSGAERDASKAAGTIAGQTVKAGAAALGASRTVAWALGKVAGVGAGTILNLLIPSTSLATETFIESSLLDGTPIHYVILDHQ